MADVINVQGWKGKATNEISEESDSYLLRCWKKHKDTGENYFTEHRVSKDSVDNLLFIIKQNCTPRQEYGPYFLWRKIIEFYSLDRLENMDIELMMSVFNGGKLRAKYYFPLYYWVMLVLAEQGHIYYGEKVWMWLG
jgi:hypothetical protein